MIVQVEILDYDLETCCDRLYCYDGETSAFPKLHYSINNTVLNSTRRSMHITFASEQSVTGRGFQLSYRAVTTSSACTTGEYVYLPVLEHASPIT